MRGWLATGLGVLLALALTGGPAHGAPVLPDLPIPRAYPESGAQLVASDQPADERAREEARANANETACNSGVWAACADLGSAYRRGEGRPENRPVAELLYRRACGAADGAGCFQLGDLLRSTREDADQTIAAQFFVRACRLGSLEGCDAEADDLAAGVLSAPDPVAAEALRRTTCERGNPSACRTLAGLLLAGERSIAEQDEGRALLDRQCRAGDAMACEEAAQHWRELIATDAMARMAEYHRLGCDAGNASLCRDLGKSALAERRGYEERAAALVFYDRACALENHYCGDAAQLREEPLIAARCEGSDGDECLKLGQLLAVFGSPLEDRARALELIGAACEAGATDVCLRAAELVFDQSRATGTRQPARADAYLTASCTAAGVRDACELLADELARGQYLPQDLPRAATLYSEQCEAGRDDACEFLEQQALVDPAAPLMMASANFAPELTPEEEAEDRRRDRDEDERKRAERRARYCTTTTVLFEGVSYTDTVCQSVVRVIGNGFTVRRGATPWQALLWRPEALGNTQLSPDERVLCGASVIREGWVLTAAHCVNDAHMGGVSIKTAGHRIRLGLTNALGDEGFSYPIIQAIPHPDYNPRVLAFDIALVQYDPKRGTRGSNALAPARIRLDPLPLGQRKIEAIPRVSTYGWGLTAVRGGTIPDQLRGARVKLRDPATCTAVTKFKDAKRRDSVLCADELKGAEGGQACSGDSGGPLITYSDADKVPTLIGVVSGGVDCGTADLPSRYIRVAHPRVQKWLNEVLPPVRRR